MKNESNTFRYPSFLQMHQYEFLFVKYFEKLEKMTDKGGNHLLGVTHSPLT